MTSPVAALPQIGRSWKYQFTNANGTSLETLLTPNASYSFAKLVGLVATNSDSANAYTLTFGVTRSGTFYPLATVSIPANSGYAAAVPPVNLLSAAFIAGLPKDADGQPYLFLEQAAGDTLQAQMASAVGSGKYVNVLGTGGEY